MYSKDLYLPRGVVSVCVEMRDTCDDYEEQERHAVESIAVFVNGLPEWDQDALYNYVHGHHDGKAAEAEAYINQCGMMAEGFGSLVKVAWGQCEN